MEAIDAIRGGRYLPKMSLTFTLNMFGPWSERVRVIGPWPDGIPVYVFKCK